MLVKAHRYYFDTSAVLRAEHNPADDKLLIVFNSASGHDPVILRGQDRKAAVALLDAAVAHAAKQRDEGGFT